MNCHFILQTVHHGIVDLDKKLPFLKTLFPNSKIEKKPIINDVDFIIARDIVENLIPHGLCLATIAKGVGRKPSLDRVYGYRNHRMSALQTSQTSLHLIQEIRDEAHRFAITGHRRQRGRSS